MSFRDRMVRGIRGAWGAPAPGLNGDGGDATDLAIALRRAELEAAAREVDALDPTRIREDVVTLCGCCGGSGYER